jgi:hypothetical protein
VVDSYLCCQLANYVQVTVLYHTLSDRQPCSYFRIAVRFNGTAEVNVAENQTFQSYIHMGTFSSVILTE